jgi:hypothetical protein
MAITAITGLYVLIGTTTTGGTAPGGATAPTGCTIAGTTSDISAFVSQIEVGADVATQDVTTFGSGGYQAFVAGLRTGMMSMTLFNDYAASQLNAVCGMNGSVISVGSSGFIEVRLTSSARSSTNPGFVAKIVNTGFRFVNATVGNAPTVSWTPVVTGGFAELTA